MTVHTVIQCPRCQQKYRIPHEQIGSQVACSRPDCHQTFHAVDINAPQSPIPPEFDDSIPVDRPKPTTQPKDDQSLSRDTELRLEGQRLAKEMTSQERTAKSATAAQGWIAIMLLAGLLGWMVFPKRQPPEPRTEWEYKLASPDDLSFDAEMARLGRDGWELVFARRATDVAKQFGYEMILKRPVKK